MASAPSSLVPLLLLEDEKNLGSTLSDRLREEDFKVSWAQNLEEAYLEIQTQRFEIALLDVTLPDGSGFEVASRLKKKQPQTAIVFLTARGSAEDRIYGLELGAEDYVVKPFHLRELILRVKNVLKRARFVMEGAEKEEVTVGQATISFPRLEARVKDETFSLSHKESALLKLLLERRGAVVSRDEILNHAWSPDEFPTPRTVDNFIMRLRRLVEVHPERPEVIKSVRKIGYQLI